RLAELYGAQLSANVTKLGETQLLSIALSAMDDRFAFTDESIAGGCAELLLQLLFAPALDARGLFPAGTIELEKRLLLERLLAERGNKRAFALRRCEEIMCEREAYGLNALGEEEAIAALAPADATAAWKRLLREARMQIVLVADADGTRVKTALRESFVSITRAPVVLGGEFIPAAEQSKFVREEQPVEQGKLILGLRAGVRDAQDRAAALRVMADLFGGGPYSKLFLQVREARSLCYYCRASFVRFKGILTVQCGVDTDKAFEARDAILEQLDLMRRGGFTDEELATAKRSMCDEIVSVADLPESLADWYTPAMLSGEHLLPEEVCARLNAVTRDDVIQAARGITLDTVYLLAAEQEGDA
ncbi:MAG: insulinase family protein, partial [Oscillospiraceae bacterium]|nr:insulinase family protein [Oscillospiraceae bacterium]